MSKLPSATGTAADRSNPEIRGRGATEDDTISRRLRPREREIGTGSAVDETPPRIPLSPSTTDPSLSYDGSEPVYRLMRLGSWGAPLMNLGYFSYSGPFAFLNVLAPLELAQRRLVIKTNRLLDVKVGQRVLDLACGRGESSFIIQCLQSEAAVVGVDLYDQHIRAAKTLYGNTKNLSFAVGNAMLLEYPDHTFNRIMCLEAAFHFPDREQFLKEAFRVLRPGGRLVVVDFAWKTDADRARVNDPETRQVRRIWQWDDFSSVSEYKQMADRAGFLQTGCFDWSSHVTRPIQRQLRWASKLSRTSVGRKFLCWKIPLYRSFSSQDWAACLPAVAAHEYVHKHSCYMAFVFEKP